MKFPTKVTFKAGLGMPSRWMEMELVALGYAHLKKADGTPCEEPLETGRGKLVRVEFPELDALGNPHVLVFGERDLEEKTLTEPGVE